ncbi:MAG TPA: amidase [Woeseiaceae bacterium]|nr:amidase [Woeseiaceae bacterium]
MSRLLARRSTLALACLLAAVVLPGNARAADDPPGEGADALHYAAVNDLQARMARGELTSERLVRLLLDRIEALDDAGPGLNAIIEINPEAIEIARGLDQERAAGELRGPLHGIPVVLKANIDTGDRMATSAGSVALAPHRAADDAHHVAALREAGAVILGKTNLSEWANFRSTRSVSGWSSIGGQTRNPHVLDRNPCGSSSGSAVAVAAGLTVLAVGTETDGSIVCPAGANGVVGIKPTVGLVSRDGIIPIALSQDTAGPMARSVRDAALLLGAMAAPDSADPAAKSHPGPRDYLAALDGRALEGARIGVWRQYFGAGSDPRVEDLFDAVVARLAELGAEIVDPVGLEIDEAVGEAEYEVLLYEFRDGLNRYLADAGLEDDRGSLAALIRFNERHADKTMPWFGQEVFELAETREALTDEAYLQAKENSGAALRRTVDALMAEHELDAIIAPTNSPAWPIDFVAGDNYSISSSSLGAITGYPGVTLPAGDVHGLPLGVTLFGRPWSEPELIGYAYALEQATRAILRPALVPTLER